MDITSSSHCRDMPETQSSEAEISFVFASGRLKIELRDDVLDWSDLVSFESNNLLEGLFELCLDINSSTALFFWVGEVDLRE